MGGVSAFRSALEEKAALCRYSYRAFQSEPRFEVGPKPELSIHLFRYAPPVLLMFLFGTTITYIFKKILQGENIDLNETNRKLLGSIMSDGQVCCRESNCKISHNFIIVLYSSFSALRQ